MNKLKEKVRQKKPIAGTHVFLPDPNVSEIIGNLGFDFIWIDTEHTTIDYSILQMHLIAAAATGTPAIVRVPWNDPILVKRVIDMGPDGIVFPMINSAEDAELAMKSCIYPPHGIRGWGPTRAIRYGLDDKMTYIREGHRELCRFVQIESVEAVKNLKEIIQNPWIDGYIFGPCDLSASIGELYQMYEEHTVALIDEAVAILKEYDKYFGVSCSTLPDVLSFWHKRGVRMISAGMDYAYIVKGGQEALSAIQKTQKQK